MERKLPPQNLSQEVAPLVLSNESYKYIPANETFTLTSSEVESNSWSRFVCDGEILIKGNVVIKAPFVLDLSRAKSINLYSGTFLRLEPGATLILSDTAMETTGKAYIIGNEAIFQAPPRHVFSENISVEGTWAIDRAYPQWFTSVKLYSKPGDVPLNDSPDWAPAINKAIRMKNSGEVCLPKGVYPVRSSIWMYYGIRLIGSGGANNTEWQFKEGSAYTFRVDGSIIMVPNDYSENGKSSFVKAPVSGGWNNDSGTFTKNSTEEPYVMFVNYRPKENGEVSGTAQEQYFNTPSQPAEIRNIKLYVSRSDTEVGVGEINGIFVHGSVSCCHIAFEDFATAIYVDDHYSDRQSFIDCYAMRKWLPPHVATEKDTRRFYFYSLGNGDGLEINRCVADNYPGMGALYLQKCNGGSVVNNIFNARVVLSQCYNVVYSGNHMEYGGQFVVDRSTVSAAANYFEKGYLPSVRMVGSSEFDMAILNLSDSKFLFFDGAHYENELHPNASPSSSGFESTNFINRVNGMSQTDISIDAYSILTLNSNYRGSMLWGFLNGWSLPKQYTYGIKIGLTSASEATEAAWEQDFNLRSSYLSPCCQIAKFKVISYPVEIPIVPPAGAHIWWRGLSELIPWVGPEVKANSVFKYEYCFLKEGAKINLPPKSLSSGQATGQYDTLSSFNAVQIEGGKDTDIVLIPNSIKEPNSGKKWGGLYIRPVSTVTQDRANLYLRRTIDNDVVEAYVPLCFTGILYDNGITIGSFAWKPVEN